MITARQAGNLKLRTNSMLNTELRHNIKVKPVLNFLMDYALSCKLDFRICVVEYGFLMDNWIWVPVNSSHGELVTGDEFTVVFLHFCDDFTL